MNHQVKRRMQILQRPVIRWQEAGRPAVRLKIRKPWTGEEKQAIYQHLEGHIRKNQLPARHMKDMHADESEVKHAKAKEPKSTNRRPTVEFERLRLKGNFYHNMEVLSTGVGQIIVARNPPFGQEVQSSDNLPCPFCMFGRQWSIIRYPW
ncbi:uncharacterized protein LOC119722051 [Patiria miniata]|uniref:Uncharacterized protein n=1 Tax=Patiria miniata TaxID=46514 RepID=A0A913ZAD0_PATMI|nr:uncharacterized protein LOC119722051 [Patiria miniata]